MATKSKTKKPAKKAPEKKPKSLDELLAGSNAYERAIANNIRARHDANIEAAIVKHQRSVRACLEYIAREARKSARGAKCAMMADDEVFSLAAHFFMDGDTPSGVKAGAGINVAEEARDSSRCRPTKKKTGKKTEIKVKKPYEQLFFDFGGEA